MDLRSKWLLAVVIFSSWMLAEALGLKSITHAIRNQQIFRQTRLRSELLGIEADSVGALSEQVTSTSMLVLGILYHIRNVIGLRFGRDRRNLHGLVHGGNNFPFSTTLVLTVLLLIVSLVMATEINSSVWTVW